MNKPSPPKLFLHFFRWFCHPRMLDYIEGDLMEVYGRRVKESGKRKADWKFILDVLLLFRPGIIRPRRPYQNLNTYSMYKSYFKIGWRNLLRDKAFSLINVGGLAMGMAAAVLIGIWAFNELSYNKTFANYSRIAMLYHNLDFGGEIISYEGAPYVLGEELKNNFSEFDEIVMVIGPNENRVAVDENTFSRSSYFADASFPDLFSLSMVQGSTDGLKDPTSIMLSRSLASTLFDGNALGKSVKFDNRDMLTVTGVFEDFPEFSKFGEIEMVVSIDYYFGLNGETRDQRTSWEFLESGCFVLLNNNTTWAEAEKKVKNIVFEKAPEVIKSLKPEAILHPMEKWNLYGDFKDGKNIGGKIKYVWMLGIVGAFILALACINFMNLSTARSEKRSKEVGIRKVMGSVRNQLIGQFMSESLMIVFIAYVFAIGLVVLFLPGFNLLSDTKLQIPWSNFYFIGISLGFIVLTGLMAGSYPALYLSSFNPVKVLKGTFKMGRYAAIPRRALVIFQFTISTALIIGTWVVFQQIQYAKERPVGFDLEGIIQLPVKTEELAKADYNSLRQDLLATGVVVNMGKSDFPITGNMSADASLTWPGKDPTTQQIVALNRGSHDFSSTNGFQFVAGRDFSRDHVTDSSSVIVNEMAAKLFSPNADIADVVGMKLTWGEGENRYNREIIGVIKDQIRWAPFAKQSPHLYFIDYGGYGFYTIRMKPGVRVKDALASIERVFEKYDPDTSFDYKFQDEDYAKLFDSEERIGKLAGVFSGLAIFISCIGIFGLASFAASQRTKEIGIRKVLGASEFSVWKMLSNDFVSLVVLSSIIACPIAYYYTNQWLQQYDYRIEVSWTIFAVTTLALLIITLVTVSYQSIKAAMANPVKNLRSD
ncbi:ABC-type antimicrobial peptide transport system permease subunit [Algoriphagus sp. 4150]|uniref:FtsX-like permease family protein n=1 Tax=Algoriphagus sp. 4150 TaxID=2817756 RepID=UPI002862701C|nr:FtsX-like permease family protein [Algoriphagus sp. 4150]MDR7130399.1 ABC-type antimicrobial peptide transport system permease subunit [Algoriphagus sp. 4150]